MSWIRIAFWAVFLAVAATCLGESYHRRFQADSLFRAQVEQAKAEAAHIQSLVLFRQRTIPVGLPFATILQNFGIERDTAAQLIASARSPFLICGTCRPDT